ncbi:transglycosylase domain-containing protein [uncultured Ruminococcus sp.]|uniref:transglycosylase domain-containing protein n=1 Tax=uncultured Ruminococcus sp. TaxID=165186 RepID=UPI002620E1A7|nr:transglycosylase domain-containing protein [uncultured Ruminococcus sp.]
MENNKMKKGNTAGGTNPKRPPKARSGAPQRHYYGPTGTPEYPYHSPELDEPTAKGKRFPVLRQTLSILGSTLAALFLILIITCTIVTTALVVYVMNFREDVSNVTIEEMELSYNTNIYAQDESGEWVEIYEVSNASQRIPISIDNIPQHVRDAFVCAEDERFYTHDGVDYKRTLSAFVNMFVHIYDTNQGGSTITQQLIKNITGDSEQSPSRKIREIFRAMELERAYSKDKILETYLNYIGFGGTSNGIEHAAQKYFGKSAADLDVAEAACLAAIPKSPETLNPFAGYTDDVTGEWVNTGRAKNKDRQEYVLWQMYDNGALTYDEYQAALHEKLIFTDTEEYKAAHPEEEEEEEKDVNGPTSWIIDAALYEVADYLGEKFNLTRQQAISRINHGGYQIYTTVNLDMQKYVEEKYLDLNNLVEKDRVAKWQDLDGDGEYTSSEIVYPESAFIAMNYKGEILSVVGATGEKTDSLCFNYATMEPRQPGSTIKPLTTYGLALENDLIHWGSVYKDEPIEVEGKKWPTNYSEDSSAMSISHKDLKIYEALEKSYNTVPAQLCDALTPQKVFEFATTRMGLDLCEDSGDGHTDIAYSPLTVGALTYGVTLENLVNGYIPYGSGGTQYEAHLVSKVVQGAGDVIFENDGNPHQAVSSETAYVMNKLLQDVVNNGTGQKAKLEKKHVAGKTGTTQDWNDLTFVGLTEDFVSGVWLGYTERSEIEDHKIKSAQIWYNIIGEYANNLDTGAEYPTASSVIENKVCAKSGKIAGPNCSSTTTGYWKSSNAPVCDECKKSYSTKPKNESSGSTTETAAAQNTEENSAATTAPAAQETTPAQ